DQAALEVEREELEHARRRGGAGDDRRVADAQRQASRAGTEDAALVDELQVRRHGPLSQVDGNVRKADADEAHTLAGELARGGGDHHSGLCEVGHCRAPPPPRSAWSAKGTNGRLGPWRSTQRAPRTD